MPPYGQPAYGQWPHAQRQPPAPPVSLRVTVVALAAAATVLVVAFAVLGALSAHDLMTAAGYADTSYALALSVSVARFGAIVFLVAAWLVTAFWMRAEVAAFVARHPNRSFGRGTAQLFLCWVVPFAAFVWGYVVVRDLQELIVPRAHRIGLGAWWAAWLGMVLLFNGAWGSYVTLEPTPEGSLIGVGFVLLAIVGVIAGWRWIAIVRLIGSWDRREVA
ncbi:MAG: hypothetical protein CMH83_08990 [Nocardioides sp.]|nr:hypothetical protein [Nocardioides sp.]